MSTSHITRSVAWLLAGTFSLSAACGDSGSGDDDDDSPTSGNTAVTGGMPTTNATASSTTGFGNNNNNNNASTTGNTLVQSNDNCDDIEPEAGEDCDDEGLVCFDAAGRSCTCGGSDRFPDGVWSCRGVLGAGGGAGASGGGAAGDNAGGQNAGGADAD